MKLSEICSLINAELFLPAAFEDIEVDHVAPIVNAGPGSITFIASQAYQKHLADLQASAIITPEKIEGLSIAQLIHEIPAYAFARVSSLFHQPSHPFVGIDENAVIHPSAKVDKAASVAPFVYVGEDAIVEEGVVLYPGVFLGKGARVGAATVLYANVSIGERCLVGKGVIIHPSTVIGADGFGFAKGADDIAKIPQLGIVRIEDEVEIGACATVDRATMPEEATVIGRGTKFDSKVHIAHNVKVGQYCMFSALTGVAGSTKIGNGVIAGGNAGFNGHIEVKDNVTIGAKAGVTRNLGPGGVYMGFPAIPAQQWRRSQIYQKRLPDFDKKIRDLEKRLESLEKESLS